MRVRVYSDQFFFRTLLETLGVSVDHGDDLIVPHVLHLESFGRTDAGTYAATCAFDLIVADPSLLINIGRPERADPKACQARHTDITVVLGNGSRKR
jgi:hypothetical protein